MKTLRKIDKEHLFLNLFFMCSSGYFYRIKSSNSCFIKIVITLLFVSVSSLHAQSPFIGIKVPWRLFLSREDEKKSYQDSVFKIIPEYFLLGTLHTNIMGRFADGLKENQVDYYESSEEQLMDFLKDYILEQFNISAFIEKGKNRINLFSIELAKIMNSYFDEKGILNMSLFDSNEKIYSYLSGYYFRRGSKLGENFYSFKGYNNIFPYSLLKKAGCNKIVFFRTKYHIPGGSIYYFEPSVPLEKYFDSVEKEMLNKIFQKKSEPEYPKTQTEKLIEQIFDNFEQM